MRTIAHLSDLHFGSVDERVLEPLVADVHAIRPDLVAVSGDLTQRARSAEFAAARSFLDRLPRPQVVVPGNHDVPLFDVARRFLDPAGKFRRHFAAETEPFFADAEIAVAGVNTSRGFAFGDGRVNREQVAMLRERLCGLPDPVTKVIVSHHPFDLPPNSHHDEVVGRAAMAMEVLAACGADLFLSGHLHVGASGSTGERYDIAGHSALVLHAGTATSTRLRNDPNSYNRIVVEHPRISVERRRYDLEKKAFVAGETESFEQGPRGWHRTGEGRAP